MKKPTFKELLPSRASFGKMGWDIAIVDGKPEGFSMSERTKEERSDYRKAMADARLFVKGCRIFFKEFFKESVINSMAVAYTGNPNKTETNFRALTRTADMIAIGLGSTFQLTNYVDGSVTLFVHRA